MVTTLEKHGDGYALVLDPALMEKLNINPQTPLKITPNGNSFTVERAADAEADEDEALFVQALEETHREYGRVLKKLAGASESEQRETRFQKALEATNKKFGRALKKLAE